MFDADVMVGVVLAGQVASAAGGLPFSRLEDIGDVLTTFIDEKCTRGDALPWLHVTLTAMPAIAIGEKEKLEFYQAVASRDRKLIQQALDDLSELCRRNRTVSDSVCMALLGTVP